MKEILDKISSYNLFNYLLPGIIFVILADKITHYSFIQQDLIIGLFLYYFIGLVISRFGSLVIEPVLRYFSFLPLPDYKEFVVASKKDKKLDLLSEINDTYRTLSSLFILLFLLKLYENIECRSYFLKEWGVLILMVVLLITFLFSYRKQTNYITERIKANKET